MSLYHCSGVTTVATSLILLTALTPSSAPANKQGAHSASAWKGIVPHAERNNLEQGSPTTENNSEVILIIPFHAFPSGGDDIIFKSALFQSKKTQLLPANSAVTRSPQAIFCDLMFLASSTELLG